MLCEENEIGCNQIDDDCDENVDEGSDMDADGFTWCASDAALRDCRDDNAGIHPAGVDRPAPEDRPCDGADNDCNGVATECLGGQACDPSGNCRVPDCSFAAPCNTGQRCNTDVSPAVCETVVDDCTQTPCTAPLICDPLRLTCEMPGQLGEECFVDAQCGSGQLCVSREALGLDAAHVGGAAQVCTQLCCVDTDCPSDSVCWAPGTGARGCVPRSILMLGANGVPDVQNCTHWTQCDEECALRSVPAYDRPNRLTYTCGPPIGTNFVACDTSSQCSTGLCIIYPWLARTECSTACGSSANCFAGERCGWLPLADGTFVQTCLLRPEGGDTDGAVCTQDSTCRDDACLQGETGRYCADTCCSDSQCAAGHSCRPRLNHGRWEMLCVQG